MFQASLTFLVAILLSVATAAPQDLSETLAKLSSSDLKERLRAQKAIEGFGKEAIPKLKELSQNADPQLQRTAQKLILRIEWDHIPDDLIVRCKAFLEGGSGSPEFRSICKAEKGLQAGLLTLQRLTASPRRDQAYKDFVRVATGSDWVKNEENYQVLDQPIQALLLLALLKSEPNSTELAASWFRMAQQGAKPLDLPPNLIRKSPEFVEEVMRSYVLAGDSQTALELAKKWSDIDQRHLGAWADLQLKSGAPFDESKHSIAQRVARLRATGKSSAALALSKELPAKFELRQILEQLHGDLSSFESHAKIAEPHKALSSTSYQQFIEFVKEPRIEVSQKLDLDSEKGNWFSDLEYLSCFGDFEEIRKQSKPHPDRLVYWIEATERTGNLEELKSLVAQPSELDLRAAIALKRYLLRNAGADSAARFLVAFEKTIPRENLLDRCRWASEAAEMDKRDLAFSWLAELPKNESLRAAYALFPAQPKVAAFWTDTLSPEGPTLAAWKSVDALLGGKFQPEQVDHYLKVAHGRSDVGTIKHIACLALLRGQEAPLKQAQRLAEVRLMIGSLDSDEIDPLAIQTLRDEARFWSEQGHYQRSLECSKHLIKLQPNSPLNHLEHSLNLALAGKTKASRHHSKIAGQLTLGQAAHYAAFAQAFDARGMDQDAARAREAILMFGDIDNAAAMKVIRNKGYQLAAEKKFAAAAQLRAIELSKVLTSPAKYRSLHPYATLSDEFRKWQRLSQVDALRH